jgi:ribosome-binding factor A
MSTTGKKKKPNIPLDDYHFHEVYDRCHTVKTMINEVLTSHPVIERFPELQEEIENAQRSLFKVSQLLANIQEKENVTTA